MGSPEGLTPEQVEARRNLVTSLVAGIASAAGADAATAGTAAGLETSQNWGQLAIPAVSAAAAKCATTPSCQRAVTYVSDKTVYGAGSALIGTSSAAVVGDVIHGRGGRPVAAYGMASDAGALAGPLVAGALSDSFGFTTAFLVTSLVSALSFLAVLRMPETRRSPVREPG